MTLRFRRDHRWVPAHASDYLDGELPERGRVRLHHHIGECPECRALIAGLKRMLGRLRDLDPPQPPNRHDIATAVRRRLRE
jgi:predicted anti-sigma-YlaC factor YlaD